MDATFGRIHNRRRRIWSYSGNFRRTVRGRKNSARARNRENFGLRSPSCRGDVGGGRGDELEFGRGHENFGHVNRTSRRENFQNFCTHFPLYVGSIPMKLSQHELTIKSWVNIPPKFFWKKFKQLLYLTIRKKIFKNFRKILQNIHSIFVGGN